MKIEIGNFSINADSNKNVWIEERSPERKKPFYYGYYSNFDDALKGFVRKRVQGSDAKSVEEALKELSDAMKDAEAMMNGWLANAKIGSQNR